MAFSNTTKNRLMMPLNIDNKLLSSSLSMSKPDNEPAAPRGIVLNTAVGGLTFAGGLMGFVTKGSKASLIAGSTFGGLLMLSSFIISKTKSAKGNILGFSVSGMLGYVMGKKFLVSKKFMPAGLLTALSAIAVVYNLVETTIVWSSKTKEATEIPPPVDDADESETTTIDAEE